MKIQELRLPAPDIAVQRDFYLGVFGFNEAATSEGDLTIQAGSSRLVFYRATAGQEGAYHFAFNIRENAFAEAKEWVSRRASLIKNSAGDDQFHFGSWNADALYFYDPAGNILEFIARHDLAPGPVEGAFDARGVLSVSEIGLSTEDVAATVTGLETGLGVEVYDGAGSDTFTAVGDIQGLLIVVKAGRVWFPDTGISARPLPVDCLIQVGETRYKLSGPPYSVAPA